MVKNWTKYIGKSLMIEILSKQSKLDWEKCETNKIITV